MRCVHESQLHEENCFITLTYDDANLPEFGSLYKPDLQKFWKRLRFHLGEKPIRYYACGEYGDHTQRAHYHACLFGHDFQDKIPFRKIGDHTLYVSKVLNELWGNGHCSVGTLTFETAAYTARYVTKKQTGLAKGGKGYCTVDPESGEIIQLVQPFAAMSLRDAIAKQWHQRYYQDTMKDFIVMRGIKLKPAKYYDQLFDKIDAEQMKVIKANRIANAQEMTDTELRAREERTRARIIYRKQI